jgi:hypothetical protein
MAAGFRTLHDHRYCRTRGSIHYILHYVHRQSVDAHSCGCLRVITQQCAACIFERAGQVACSMQWSHTFDALEEIVFEQLPGGRT